MAENFGGSLNLIIWIVLTLGAFIIVFSLYWFDVNDH